MKAGGGGVGNHRLNRKGRADFVRSFTCNNSGSTSPRSFSITFFIDTFCSRHNSITSFNSFYSSPIISFSFRSLSRWSVLDSAASCSSSPLSCWDLLLLLKIQSRRLPKAKTSISKVNLPDKSCFVNSFRWDHAFDFMSTHPFSSSLSLLALRSPDTRGSYVSVIKMESGDICVWMNPWECRSAIARAI